MRDLNAYDSLVPSRMRWRQRNRHRHPAIARRGQLPTLTLNAIEWIYPVAGERCIVGNAFTGSFGSTCYGR